MNRITAWPELNVNFWSITKCANTAMKIHMFNLTKGNIELRRDTDINKHLKFITKEQAAYNNFINFTLVRNPYTRFLSSYNYVRYKRPKKLKDIGLPQECTLDQFIRFLYDNRYNNDLDPHLRKQISFITYDVTNIYKIETLENNWNLDFPVLQDKKNANQKKEVLELTDKQKEDVYKLYKEDFDFLNYQK